MICLLASGLLAYSTGDSPKNWKPVSEEVQRVSEGVTYTHSYYGKSRWSVHILEVDLTVPGIHFRIAKGLDNIAGLERVGSIAHRYDSIYAGASVLAAVNANFWKAGTNHPMGPTVADGEILKARQYKKWSSVAVTESGKILFDRFDVQTSIKTQYGDISIDRYNLRKDSLAVVIYSRYFGNSVPFIDTLGIMEASEDTITDDSEIDNLVTIAIDSLWGMIPEAGTLKMQFEYVSSQQVNGLSTCRVTDIDTGIVTIPRNGGIISFGDGNFPLFFSLFVGDTFSIASRVSPEINEPVLEMTGGTPRLIRDGKVHVEWKEEGLRKKRFVTGKYGRTAIGVNKDHSKLILMTVEASHSRRRPRTRGIALTNLAELLILRGAHNAMNFDGGSSATMVVNHKAVSNNGNPYTRKISTAFMVVQEDSKTPALESPQVTKPK
jgi:exopolysaccharide biosynthesis protein